ncbi:MAG: hypothetical protein CFE44_02055 [Burkholderiales bacterium PBB4]|nr:MAG: hypothetical protein CFE44_02055 [Burkholderiales bacterium PBB4]
MRYCFAIFGEWGMAGLRWIAIVFLAALGAYFGHRLTGAWAGIPLGGVAMGLAAYKLFAGDWLISLITLVVGFAVLFQLIGSAPVPNVAAKGVNPALAVNDGSGEKRDAGLMSDLAKTVGAQVEKVEKSLGPKSASDSGRSAGAVFKDCPTCPEMVVVPAGEFSMGSSPAQGAAADGREGPAHKVVVRGFSAGRFAVTRGQFAEFVKATNYVTDAERGGGCFALLASGWGIQAQWSWRNPGFKQADDHPAVCISWNDTQAYAAWLSATTKHKYRLLSESEREYTTRAGSTTAYWWGDAITPEQANYNAGATSSDKTAWRKATVPVHQFAANPMGLYQVHGNVWEWVHDCQHDNYQEAPVDGSAWVQKCVGAKRMMRGGGWVSDALGLRAAHRAGFAADLPSHAGGFRVARD